KRSAVSATHGPPPEQAPTEYTGARGCLLLVYAVPSNPLGFRRWRRLHGPTSMREASDRDLWAWIAGEAAAERLSGVPLSRIERLGEADLIALVGGRRRAARAVRAVAELGRRFVAAPPPAGAPFCSARDVARSYLPRLAHEEREFCYVLALD